MAGNTSRDDFHCCGSWYFGCAIDAGCQYGQLASSTEEEQNKMLLHAMKHCEVFKKMYIQRDEEFIKVWKDSAKRAHLPDEQRFIRRSSASSERTTTKVNNVLKEAEALLKSLGL